MKISLIHASFNSEGRSIAVRDKWYELADSPINIEHCLGFEDSDHSLFTEYGITPGSKTGFSKDMRTRFATTINRSSPSAVRNWNAAAKLSTGDILVTIADDLIPEVGWDTKIIGLADVNPLEVSRIWKVTDFRCARKKDYTKGDIFLPRHPLITRHLYKKYNYIFDPRFYGVGADDQWLLLSIQNQILFDARQIKFHHAVGPIFNSKKELVCGCKNGVEKNVQTRTESQNRIHTSKLEAETILSKEWKPVQMIARNLLCDSRFAKFTTNISHDKKIVLKNRVYLSLLYVTIKFVSLITKIRNFI